MIAAHLCPTAGARSRRQRGSVLLHGRADEKNATGADRCSGRERVLVDDGCDEFWSMTDAALSDFGEIHLCDVFRVHVRDSIHPIPQRSRASTKICPRRDIWLAGGCLAVARPCLVLATDRPRVGSTVFRRVLLGRGGVFPRKRGEVIEIEAGICNKLWRIDICVGHVAPQTRAIAREPLNFDADHAQRAL
jgi:hypothetical protein